jgi:hypothetical protein
VAIRELLLGSQDIARAASRQRSDVARLVERSLRIAVVTHLRPFLFSVNRKQGAIPESGHTILLTSSLFLYVARRSIVVKLT